MQTEFGFKEEIFIVSVMSGFDDNSKEMFCVILIKTQIVALHCPDSVFIKINCCGPK